MKLRRTSILFFALLVAVTPSVFGQTARDSARRARGNGRIASNSLRIGGNSIMFSGNYSYQFGGGNAILKADTLTNSNASASGPLRFSLWFTTSPYPASGYNTAQYPITNSLAAGGTIAPVNGSNTTVPITLPGTGCYYVTLVLEEQVSGTWTMRDYGTFALSIDIGGGCITSFAATPPSISAGNSSTLSWTLIGTATPSIDHGIGTQPKSGSISVSPSATTTYTLTASNTANGNVVSKQATVTVTLPAPSITSLTPNHGPAAGGNNVTVSGTNLTGATSVTFGGTPASLGVNNGTSLAVVAPAHAAGAVTVQVTTPNGSATSQYTYDAANAPAISSISPSSGPTSGGQTVTITGANFGTGNVVTFDTSTASILAATSTSLVVRTPAHAAGKVTVSVTMPSGTATTQYTYSETMRIVSVVGSTAGSFGSFFRTAMQLHNDSSTALTGTMVFHPSGAAGPNDPSLPFSLTPGQTKSIDDLVAALNSSGVGSLDITSDGVDAILFSSRIYNDAGSAGTTGMSIDPLAPGDALQQSDVALLLVPADSGARFNVGVRSLGSGATLNVSLYTADGQLRTSTSHTYDANAFAQTDAATFAGAAPAPNETIVITVNGGSAIVYGAMTDNKTQDPTYQAAKSLASLRSRGQVGKLVVPVVGSVAGSFNSFFRTSMQLHNAGGATINGSIIFHPQATSGSSSDPSMTYSLAAGQTISFSDVVSSIHTSGIGSLDITSSDFTSLLVLARIYNDAGAAGTTGMGLTAMAPGDALQPGQTGVLLAPAHTDVFRYNVGVRSLDDGASVQFTVIDSNGNTKATSTKTFTPNFFQQYGASDLLGTTIAANDAILISVNSGAVIVYGSTTDNRTQDPTYAVAHAE